MQTSSRITWIRTKYVAFASFIPHNLSLLCMIDHDLCRVSSPSQYVDNEIIGSSHNWPSCSELCKASPLLTTWCGGLIKGQAVCHVILLEWSVTHTMLTANATWIICSHRV
jgi:hypothetical protein